MLNNFLIIPLIKETINIKLALAIPTGPLSTLVKEMIDTPPLVTLKTITVWSM